MEVNKGTPPMATRSRIGLQLSDDSIVSVYCHYDGYPAHNGRVLRTHFDTIEKVRELIDGGDMSCTRTNVDWNNETLPEVGPLYYSARGEDCPPRHDETMTEFFNNCLLYTSPSPRDRTRSRMPSSA